jgi:hypothetical protein
MKISVLIKREPFSKIFEETLSSFLFDYSKISHEVKWNPNNVYRNNRNMQLWYCNPLINSIFVRNVNKNVFNSVKGEYTHNPLKPWRSVIQRLYLVLAQLNITGPLMSKYTIGVCPPIKDAKSKLIIGGNTKIRIIDIVNQTVYVILKNGFDKKYLEREIYVRNHFTYIPIPRIISYGRSGRWYCEEYITGISPNRVRGNSASSSILVEAVQIINKMHVETQGKELLCEYVAVLQHRISCGVGQISKIDSKVKDLIIYLASSIANKLILYPDGTLTTAFCHGDFHQGNILVNGEKFWILDWEHSGKRQIGYDLIILLLQSRIHHGYANRFIRLADNMFDNQQLEIIRNWPALKWDDKGLKKVQLYLFLLEELDFHVEENKNKLFFGDPIALFEMCREIEKIMKHLT